MANKAGTAAPPPEAENPAVVLGANIPPEGEALKAKEPEPQQKEYGKLSDSDRASLLLTHLATARDDGKALEEAMEVVRGVRKRRNRNRNLCKTDGFLLDELDKILADEVRARHELEEEASLRKFMRETAGLPTGLIQGDLFAAGADKDQPNTVTEARTRQDGYHAGLAGEDAKVPEYIPPELHQVWLEERDRGQKALFKAWEVRQTIEKGRQA